MRRGDVAGRGFEPRSGSSGLLRCLAGPTRVGSAGQGGFDRHGLIVCRYFQEEAEREEREERAQQQQQQPAGSSGSSHKEESVGAPQRFDNHRHDGDADDATNDAVNDTVNDASNDAVNDDRAVRAAEVAVKKLGGAHKRGGRRH